MPLVIPEFTQKYPYVRIELPSARQRPAEVLIEGVCDLALITTSPKRRELHYELLVNEEIVLMADQNTNIAQRLPDGTTIDIAEAENEAFVMLRHGHSVRSIQEHLFQLRGFTPKVLLESNSLELAKRVAANARAVMLCPYVYIAQSPEARARVRCYPIRAWNTSGICICATERSCISRDLWKIFLPLFAEAEHKEKAQARQQVGAAAAG
ncbi:MAG: substrate-binding domain-containing protein [Christensenellales bacterium]